MKASWRIIGGGLLVILLLGGCKTDPKNGSPTPWGGGPAKGGSLPGSQPERR